MKLTLWLIIMMVTAQLCSAEDSDNKTLAGITAVKVLIEELSQGAAALGLTKESLRTDVELKLRLATLQVKEDAPTWVYVNVSVAVSPLTNDRAADILVEILQPVRLVRDSTIGPFHAMTWSKGTVIARPSAQMIRTVVKDAVDTFLNAWLSVNPKK